MPYKEWNVEKVYWKIGEVAKMLDVETSTIRFVMEKHKMHTKRSGLHYRMFNKEEIEHLKNLLHFREWSREELVEHVIFCHEMIKDFEDKLKKA